MALNLLESMIPSWLPLRSLPQNFKASFPALPYTTTRHPWMQRLNTPTCMPSPSAFTLPSRNGIVIQEKMTSPLDHNPKYFNYWSKNPCDRVSRANPNTFSSKFLAPQFAILCIMISSCIVPLDMLLCQSKQHWNSHIHVPTMLGRTDKHQRLF